MAHAVAPKSMAVPLAEFAAGAVVALLVGVSGKAHHPARNGTTTVIVILTSAVWYIGKEGRPA
jgi:hypothetical protein